MEKIQRDLGKGTYTQLDILGEGSWLFARRKKRTGMGEISTQSFERLGK